MPRFGTLPARSLAFAGALFAALVLALIVGQGARADDTGRVRVMHASPDTPAVDIFVDGQKAVTALAFPNNTGYVALPAGAHLVEAFVSPSDGSGDPALSATLNVAAGADYTVLATGLLEDGTLGLYPLQDNNALPAEGNAHVRLIHAAPDAPPVDVLVAGTDTKVFTGVAFNNFAGPNPVPAGTYDLEVQVNPTGPVVLEVPGVMFANRTVYTVVAVGLAGDGSLTIIPLLDAQPSAAPSPAPNPPSTGNAAFTADGDSASYLWLIVGGLAIATAGGATVMATARSSNR